MRKILHIDMDAFYASVEQQDNPEFRGKPVIVGADPRAGAGRGVVAACSYEARRFGIHSALPIGQAWRLCPDGIYLRPRFSRYQEISGQIMDVFREYTDTVEPLSIDEAFLDVTGSTTLMGPADRIGGKIKAEIRERTGLTASVGVAPNKFLAKVASDLDKPDGFVVVPDDGAAAFLAPLPISRLWGVGPRTESRLRALGLETIGDLATRGRDRLVADLGSGGGHLWNLAVGIDDRPVIANWAVKSVSNETTFERDTRDRDALVSTLRRLSDQVAARLRKKHLRAGTVTLKLRYSSFTTYTRQSGLREPTGDGEIIFQRVRALFDRFELDEPVRLIGVGTTRLTGADGPGTQLGLFADSGADSSGKLSDAMDRIHERFGNRALHRASDLP
jgi:nucleotidyltransferase/DNA polymerase involved in DNA repair